MRGKEIASGRIRTKIEGLSAWTGDEDLDSAPTTIAGIPWKINVSSEKSVRTGYVRYFGVYLYCNYASTMHHGWSVHCKRTFSLIAQDGSGRTHTKNGMKIYNYDSRKEGWGFRRFIDWGDLMNKSNPWVRNNSVEVEVHIVVTKLEGIDYPLEAPFSSSTKLRTDVALLIDGHRLYVNKNYLATHSPVFEAMFFGRYSEQSAEEIPIKDVDYNEFLTFLRVIYPTQQCIDDSNVEVLLKLADFYDVKKLMNGCKQFLSERSKLSKQQKLLLADKFRLSLLLNQYIASYSTVEELQALISSDEYVDLSEDSKATLLKKCLQMEKEKREKEKREKKKMKKVKKKKMEKEKMMKECIEWTKMTEKMEIEEMMKESMEKEKREKEWMGWMNWGEGTERTNSIWKTWMEETEVENEKEKMEKMMKERVEKERMEKKKKKKESKEKRRRKKLWRP